MLDMRHVSKTFGVRETTTQALHDVSLTVQPGELIAVMGPSGSGKSTLLAIAGGLMQPDMGDVTLNGSRPRRKEIGYVFQDFNLMSGLTAAENVALPLELDGIAGRKALLAAIGALRDIGLEAKAGRYPDQLSGGERQRVAIARAIAGRRLLLLADEPSGSLDSLSGEQVMRNIRNACKGSGMAALMVTHDATLAAWADRVLFLRDGSLVDRTAGQTAGRTAGQTAGQTAGRTAGRTAPQAGPELLRSQASALWQRGEEPGHDRAAGGTAVGL
jgi:putative ABC transport system ATP-binding protein